MTQLAVNNTEAEELESLPPLTQAERDERIECERQIEDGLESFWRIKTRKLYRGDYESFADYMQKRWGKTERSGNQSVAAYTAIMLLRDSLAGTDVPIPSAEYTIRPIASIMPPERMVEIYQTAVDIAEGRLPTHDIVLEAREIVLGEKEKKLQSARLQIEACVYDHLKAKLAAGEDPIQLEALMDTLNSADPYVRSKMIAGDIKDRTLIKRLSELYLNGRDTAEEILASGYIQYADGNAIKLRDATAKDLQRLLTEKWREHVARSLESKNGMATSVVVFDRDAKATLRALESVLSEETLTDLAHLILKKEN